MRKRYTGQLLSYNLQPWYPLSAMCPPSIQTILLSNPLDHLTTSHLTKLTSTLSNSMSYTPKIQPTSSTILSRLPSPGFLFKSHFLPQNYPSWPVPTTDWLNLLLTELNKHQAQNCRPPLKQANCSQPSVHITISWKTPEKYGYLWITPDQLNEIL